MYLLKIGVHLIEQPTEKSHELEIELSDIESLKVEAENAKDGRPSKYPDMVRVFVDNVRLLARLEKVDKA